MTGHVLEAAAFAAARAALGDGLLATAKLAAAVTDRSRRYTSDRAHLAAPADKLGDLAARATFFTITDALKLAVPLGELAGRAGLPSATPLRVTDLGAGCGAMSLGLVATIDRPLAITAIDRDHAALGIAAAAVRELARARDVTITTRTDDATRAAIPPSDVITIGTMLNELPADARLPLVLRALAALADDGALIIVEPALRDTTRALHELRDAVLARSAAHVFAPCTRRGAPCPALAHPDDWCHEHRTAALPPRTAELARLTHLRDDGLRFSYLVLRKDPRPLVDAPGAWRIVGSPRAQKGKLEVPGCSDAGRLPIRLLRRNRSDANRAIERVERGDVVVIDAPAGDDRVELVPETTVVPTGGR